jgi:Cytosol aminopeptidase family, N-terminal domain
VTRHLTAFLAVAILWQTGHLFVRADDLQPVKEQVIAGPQGVQFKVRMEGPYTADVPLQVVCYFRYTAAGAKKMKGAPVELDKKLGGLIGALRERGEFTGDAMETILFDAPADTIKAKKLLLVGLGDERDLSLELMEKVGRTALRTAKALGVSSVAIAPLIRDQGNDSIKTGDVENAVTRGVLLAYDTDRRLQKQGFAKAYTLDEWAVEAGPAYFDETVAGVKKAIAQAAATVEARDPKPYSTKSK